MTDRFGNHTTGFSGIGISEFNGTGQTAGLALLKAFGYDPRRFKGVVARTLLFPEPVSQNIKFINNINGVPTECWNCINVEQTVSNLRFERDDSNLLTTRRAKPTSTFAGISSVKSSASGQTAKRLGQGRLLPTPGHH